MIDPHGEPNEVISDVPELSVEEVEKRIGVRSGGAPRRVTMARPAPVRAAADRRIVLWRDSATILVGVVVALLAWRFVLAPSTPASFSATPTDSPVEIGSIANGTGLLFSVAPTLGGVVNPSLKLDSTPTPPPLITLPPPTPTPSPSPTAGPSHSPGPSVKPTAKPTPKPTVKPTAAPPVAHFTWSCDAAGGGLVDFDASASTPSTGVTYAWDFDDNGASGTGVTTSHTFSGAGPYGVVLTVTSTASGLTDTVIAGGTGGPPAVVPCP